MDGTAIDRLFSRAQGSPAFDQAHSAALLSPAWEAGLPHPPVDRSIGLSLCRTDRIDHLYQDPHVDDRRFILRYGDLTSSTDLIRLVQEVQPDEIYNLAAPSHVQVSFETAGHTANSDALGTLRLLEAIRILGLEKKTRSYQASTSELYGKVRRLRRPRRRLSIHAAPTRSPSSTPTGSR